MLHDWPIRVAAKLLMSRLPIGYDQWARLGLFRHGHMDDPECAWEVLSRHHAVMSPLRPGWKGLELGPGDSVLSALLAPALESGGVTLVDAGRFAHQEIARYLRSLELFSKNHNELSLPDYSRASTVSEMLSLAGSSYLHNKLDSMRSIASGTIDCIWSEAVLEHVRVNDYREVACEMRRLITRDGVMSHVIDFKDHLGGGLNNLRFSSSLWEREWFAPASGFYTNRYPLSWTIRLFESSGFSVEVKEARRWENPPLPRRSLAKEFREFSGDDMSTQVAHLVMRPK